VCLTKLEDASLPQNLWISLKLGICNVLQNRPQEPNLQWSTCNYAVKIFMSVTIVMGCKLNVLKTMHVKALFATATATATAIDKQ
jgi:hypothetical protein